MAKKSSDGTRARGTIERRGNSLRIKVYAGLDPLTGKRLYLRESTTDEAEAERILTRLLNEVDEQRNAKKRRCGGPSRSGCGSTKWMNRSGSCTRASSLTTSVH